ncbi:MAG TPA: nucleoside hydrolase [Vicinamibacteria bacterium]|jgi:inosine-uridine nucleoside N-ribohydrolase
MKTHGLWFAFFVIFLVAAALRAGQDATVTPVVLDVDPGIDDALAILLALSSPELSVEGITVVAGNVEVDVGLRNARQILELAGRSDIPVARGAEAPLVGRLVTSRHVHGDNGLGNVELPAPAAIPYPGTATDLIVNKIREHAGRITLIPVGPLTNIAIALKQHPELVPDIKAIVLMGGSLSGGNITPAAEFNIYNDPEAAEMVFHSGAPIVMVGLDVTEKTILGADHLRTVQRAASPISQLVWSLTEFHLNERGAEGIMMHDPLAVGVAIDPSFVETKRLHVGVETKGEMTRGETVAARRGYSLKFLESHGTRTVAGQEDLPPNAEVCVGVDSERFLDFFVKRVLGDRR